MSTRGVIARLTGTTPPRFRGRYHHWDSYPTGLGKMLWHLYHGHFQQDLNAMLRVLLDEHPAGWNTIVGRDFDLLPEFSKIGNNTHQGDNEGTGALRPECYCHGDQGEEAWEVTEKNASGSGCEWAYAFSCGQKPEHDLMVVLSSYRSSGQKMVGFFGQGDPRAVWAPIAVLALQGVEPNWNALDGAPPLDPMFNKHRSEAPAPPLVERDEGRAGIYTVRLPQDAPHYVLVKLEDHLRVFYCTCSRDEEAPSPSCAHTQATRTLLQERDERARGRQGRGLLYVGQRLGDGRCLVMVWEEGRPSLLDPTPSQRLRSHSPSGFDWGYSGSGPAQLALALLLDFSGDEELALNHHQAFKARVIAALPQDTPWRMKGMDISDFLRAVSNSRE